MLAEVVELEIEECGSRGGDEHLPATSGGGDPRRAVDVGSHVPLAREERRSRVQPDAHLSRP